jgi:hypothetical protein
MYELIDYFKEATIGELVLGLIVGVIVIRVLISIIFE